MSGYGQDVGRTDTADAGGGTGAYSAPASDTTAAPDITNIEYRIAHLEARLAAEELGELGMRIDTHGAAVTVRGTVPTARCREELLHVVHEELVGLAVHTDIQIAEVLPPGHPEELT